jgi:hypothetical protein
MRQSRQVRYCDVLNELISFLGTIVVLGEDVEDEGGSGDWTRCIKGDGAKSAGTNVHLVEVNNWVELPLSRLMIPAEQETSLAHLTEVLGSAGPSA